MVDNVGYEVNEDRTWLSNASNIVDILDFVSKLSHLNRDPWRCLLLHGCSRLCF